MKIGTTKVDFDLPPIFHPQRHKERYFEFSSYTNFELKGSSNGCNIVGPKAKPPQTIQQPFILSVFSANILEYRFSLRIQFYPKDLKIKTLKPNILTLLFCMVLALLDLFERILLRQLVVLGNAL
jgi:hypothetical protein